MSSKGRRTALETTEATLGALALADLYRLRDTVDALIAALEDDQTEATVTASAPTANPNGNAGGYVELKTINGCGPYAYLRFAVYQSGRRTLKSKYLGKARGDGSGS